MLEIRGGREEIKGLWRRPRPHATPRRVRGVSYGKWWSANRPCADGGFAKKTLEAESADRLIIRAKAARPGDIEIVAIGQLTNIATAIRRGRRFVSAVKRIVINGRRDCRRYRTRRKHHPERRVSIFLRSTRGRRVVLRSEPHRGSRR